MSLDSICLLISYSACLESQSDSVFGKIGFVVLVWGRIRLQDTVGGRIRLQDTVGGPKPGLAVFCAPKPRIQRPNPAQIRTYPPFLQFPWYFQPQPPVWQRSLANCSAQKPISAGVLLTFSNLFAIPPGPPPALEVANGAAGASVELQGGPIRV